MNSLDDLRVAVTETLETKGVLGKVKAQLRASVFSAIQEEDPASHGYLANPVVKSIHSNSQTKLAAELILEFMEFFELDFSQSVFTPECTLSDPFVGRDSLERKLNIDSASTEVPLLVHILNSYSSGGAPGTPQAAHVPVRSEAEVDAEIDAMLAGGGSASPAQEVESPKSTISEEPGASPGAGGAGEEEESQYEDEFEDIEEDIEASQASNLSDNPLSRSNEDVLKSLPPATGRNVSLAPVGLDSVNSITSPVPSVKDLSFDDGDRPHQHSSDFEASMEHSTGVGGASFESDRPSQAGALAPIGGASSTGSLPPLRGRTQLAPIGGAKLAPLGGASKSPVDTASADAQDQPKSARSTSDSETVSQKTADESWNGDTFGSDDDIVEDIETVDFPSDEDDDNPLLGGSSKSDGRGGGNSSLGQSQDVTFKSEDFGDKYEYYEEAVASDDEF